MKRALRYFLFIFLIFSFNNSFSQYYFEWAETYGGSGWDEATCLLQTSNQDIYVAGSMRLEEENMWLLKLDAETGKSKWGKTFFGYYISRAHDIIETFDNNIVIAGYTIPFDSVSSNFWILKIDTLGNTIWEKNYGTEYDDIAYSIIQTKDGGYVAAGAVTSSINQSLDWWILRLDENGEILWKKQFGGKNEDIAKGATEMPDGSIVVTGYVGLGNSYRTISAVKFNPDGEELWYKSYTINNWEESTSIITTSDSCVVISGFIRQEAITDYDALAIKLNSQGDTIWQRIFGRDYFNNIPSSNNIGYHKKVISDFNKEYWDEATDLIESFDNGIILGGFSKANELMKSDFMFVKYSSDGELLWFDFFNRNSLDISKGLIETKDNALMLAGVTYSLGNIWDYAVLKYSSGEKSRINIYNPTDTLLTVTTDTISHKICIYSYRPPLKLTLIVNSEIQNIITEFPERDDLSICPFLFDVKLELQPGLNKIEIRALDDRDYEFSDFRTIYYFPSPAKTW